MRTTEGTVIALQNPIKENTNLQDSYLAHELRVCVQKNNIIINNKNTSSVLSHLAAKTN